MSLRPVPSVSYRTHLDDSHSIKATLRITEERLRTTIRERDMYSTQLRDMTRLWHDAVQERNRYLLSQKEAERLLVEVDARLHDTIMRNEQLLKEKESAVEATRMMILRMQLANLEAEEQKRKRQRCVNGSGSVAPRKRSREEDYEVERRISSLGLQSAGRKRVCTASPVCCTLSHKIGYSHRVVFSLP